MKNTIIITNTVPTAKQKTLTEKQKAIADQNKQKYRNNITALNSDPKNPEKQIAVAEQCVRSVLRKLESVGKTKNDRTDQNGADPVKIVKRIRENMFEDLVSTALIRYYELANGLETVDIEKTITVERRAKTVHKIGETPKVKTLESSILKEMLHAIRHAIIAEKTPLDSKNIIYISLDDPNFENDILLSTPSPYDFDKISDVEKSQKILNDLRLTPTEKNCVSYALKGDSKKQIADRLKIKTPTVYRHFERISEKMLQTDLYSHLLKCGISYRLAQKITPTVHVPFVPFVPYADPDRIFTPTAKIAPTPENYFTLTEKLKLMLLDTPTPTPFSFATKCIDTYGLETPDPVDPDPVDPDPTDLEYLYFNFTPTPYGEIFTTNICEW